MNSTFFIFYLNNLLFLINKDGDRSKLIYKIRGILSKISGDNIIGMLNDVLRENEREELIPRYKMAIENIAKVVYFK